MKYYLMTTKDGFTVRVPEDKLESWQKAQEERGKEPLSKSEQRLKDRIVSRIYGSRK